MIISSVNNIRLLLQNDVRKSFDGTSVINMRSISYFPSINQGTCMTCICRICHPVDFYDRAALILGKVEKMAAVNTVVGKSIPKEAQIMAAILKDMGVNEYEPRVVNQMMEFSYREYMFQFQGDLFCQW